MRAWLKVFLVFLATAVVALAQVNPGVAAPSLVGLAQTTTALVAADKHGFTLQGVVTGLTLGTAYWFDVSLLSVTAGTSTVTQISAVAMEE